MSSAYFNVEIPLRSLIGHDTLNRRDFDMLPATLRMNYPSIPENATISFERNIFDGKMALLASWKA